MEGKFSQKGSENSLTIGRRKIICPSLNGVDLSHHLCNVPSRTSLLEWICSVDDKRLKQQFREPPDMYAFLDVEYDLTMLQYRDNLARTDRRPVGFVSLQTGWMSMAVVERTGGFKPLDGSPFVLIWCVKMLSSNSLETSLQSFEKHVTHWLFHGERHECNEQIQINAYFHEFNRIRGYCSLTIPSLEMMGMRDKT